MSSEATEHVESVKATISMTVLVMVETLCRSVWAYAVSQKGAADALVADQIVEDLEVVGLTGERIIVKTDQEWHRVRKLKSRRQQLKRTR